jgi:PAS domain S-box-containing protein
VSAVGVSEEQSSIKAQLRATADVIPAHVWYATASDALVFVNSRIADYLGLPKDHPLRFGIDVGGEWDSHIDLLHPEDRQETRHVWSNCLRTDSAGEAAFRIRNAEGGYRWFLSRAEPVLTSQAALVSWIGIDLDIEKSKHAEFYLVEGQRLARTGSWTFNPAGFEYWSSELFRIHGLDPSDQAPTREEYLALVHPEIGNSSSNTLKGCGRPVEDSTSRSESSDLTGRFEAFVALAFSRPRRGLSGDS